MVAAVLHESHERLEPQNVEEENDSENSPDQVEENFK